MAVSHKRNDMKMALKVFPGGQHVFASRLTGFGKSLLNHGPVTRGKCCRLLQQEVFNFKWFYELFTRWIWEMNAQDSGNVPSGGKKSHNIVYFIQTRNSAVTTTVAYVSNLHAVPKQIQARVLLAEWFFVLCPASLPFSCFKMIEYN